MNKQLTIKENKTPNDASVALRNFLDAASALADVINTPWIAVASAVVPIKRLFFDAGYTIEHRRNGHYVEAPAASTELPVELLAQQDPREINY